MTDHADWPRVKELFQSTLRLPSHERSRFLDEQCAGRPALRSEVESLLSAHADAGSFVQATALGDLTPSLALDLETLLPAPVPMRAALEAGERLGPYVVDHRLGTGGMGEVYRATDTNLKRTVAIKVLPEAVATDGERLARFQREAEVLASLNHPNIGAIHGLEESGRTRALVMELVEGQTLADRIASGPIPVDEALAIAKQIAEALDAAHEKGITHRDLKPANIKLRDDGTVKVLDFGLAKLGSSGAD